MQRLPMAASLPPRTTPPPPPASVRPNRVDVPTQFAQAVSRSSGPASTNPTPSPPLSSPVVSSVSPSAIIASSPSYHVDV